MSKIVGSHRDICRVTNEARDNYDKGYLQSNEILSLSLYKIYN